MDTPLAQSLDAEARTFQSELRRVVDAVLCVGVGFIVAELLGVNPLSGPVEFAITAAVGDLAYGLLLVCFDAAKRRFGAPESSSPLVSEPAQRFQAKIAPDAFAGVWQLARAPGEFEDDLKVTYRRVTT